MELREKIADSIVGEIGPQNPNNVEVYAIADAILAIPEIRERFFCDCGKPRLVGSCTGYCDNDE